jgi:hypothetical protein
MPVAREVVGEVMSSLTEGDAGLLEKPLKVLRKNAHQGLEHVAKVKKLLQNYKDRYLKDKETFPGGCILLPCQWNWMTSAPSFPVS